eukprot:scaffold19820_cov69-Phaeocystis_antarctica.AAC.3
MRARSARGRRTRLPDAAARGRRRCLAPIVGGAVTATDEVVSVPSTKAAELAPLRWREVREVRLRSGAALLLFAQPQHALGAEHCGVAGGDKRRVQPACLGRAGLGHSREKDRCRQQAGTAEAVSTTAAATARCPLRLPESGARVVAQLPDAEQWAIYILVLVRMGSPPVEHLAA